MPRKADQGHLDALQTVIQKHPGKKAGFLARLLNWRREEVNRRLVSLNDRGVLLSEDKHGGLWPFEDKFD